MADPVEAAELLDVDVDQLAGVLALVAADRLGRLEVADRGSGPRRRRMRLTVAGETPAWAAICLPVKRWRRSASTCSTIAVRCRPAQPMRPR